ncbi:MAG: hypothetical protein OCD76_07365 [Reichenbachiella sp.]
MAKLTLLSIVNSYMDATDGFRVSSIDDTIEAQQLASIAEKVFNDLVNDVFSSGLTENLVQLESLADSAKPNYLRLPDTAMRINDSKVMYNITNGEAGSSTLNFVEIEYMRPEDFLDYVGRRSTNETNTQIVTDYSGYQMVIKNKTAPQFYTDFDDEHLVFDSFDSDVDSVLQSSKSGILTSVQRTFTQSDVYVIDFPEWFHPTYLNAVISEASEVLREEPIFSISRKARIGILKARKKEQIGNKGLETRKRNYGR